MKQLFFSLSLITVVLLGCTGESQNNSGDNNQEADNQSSINYEVPKLMELTQQSDNEIYTKLSAYVEFLNNDVTDFDAINKAFAQRDELIESLNDVLFDFEENNDLYDNPEWDTIETELNKIGYFMAYAEGMCVGLQTSEMLLDEINEYAPEDYKLYLDIVNKVSETMGGEYPFSNLQRFFDVVVAYEKLQKEFPNSKYLDKVEVDFKYCLNVVTNIHYTGEFYLVGEFTTDPYPTVTDKAELEAIVANYPNSKYTPIIEKVLQNMSYFASADAPIFAVVIDKFNDDEQAADKQFEYLNNGKDIVHIISTDAGEYYTCYRYYDDEATAKTALDSIKSDFPEAHIIKFSLVESEFDYVADSKTVKIID